MHGGGCQAVRAVPAGATAQSVHGAVGEYRVGGAGIDGRSGSAGLCAVSAVQAGAGGGFGCGTGAGGRFVRAVYVVASCGVGRRVQCADQLLVERSADRWDADAGPDPDPAGGA